MARGEQQQVSQRGFVDAMNPNKHNMPDGRRLRVTANPINMQVEAQVPTSVRLAQALSAVKPQLMDYATDVASDANAIEVNQGKQDALKGLSPDEQRSQWRDYGYQYQSSYLKGEDLGAKLEADLVTKDPKVPFEQWYGEWWEANGSAVQVSPEHSTVFNKSFGASLVKARDADTANRSNLKFEEESSVTTESMYRTLMDIRGKKLPFTSQSLGIIYNDTKGFTNQQKDLLFFNAITRYATENNDVDVLNVLYEKRNDGTLPALVDNPKYTSKITALRTAVINKTASDLIKTTTATDKLMKAKTAQAEEDFTLRRIEIMQMDDTNQRKQAMEGLWAEVQEQAEEYEYTSGFLSKFETKLGKAKDGEETVEQHAEYRRLFAKGASNEEWNLAVDEDRISESLWEKGITKMVASRKADDRSEIDRANRITKYKAYGHAEDSLKKLVGYNPMVDVSNKAGVIKNGYTASVLEYYHAKVDANLDAGMNDLDAIADAKEATEAWATKNQFIDKAVAESRAKLKASPQVQPKTAIPKGKVPDVATLVDTFDPPSKELINQINEDPYGFYTGEKEGRELFRYHNTLQNSGITISPVILKAIQDYYRKSNPARD